MSKVCDICGKHAVAGRSISHSHRTVNRTFKPNIQRVTVFENGRAVKKNVCTRCLKSGKVACREEPGPRARPNNKGRVARLVRDDPPSYSRYRCGRAYLRT